MTPQLILTLSPSGVLLVELPGANGSRRRIELKAGEAEGSLLRMLQAQLRREVEIGLDGAPTERQVEHWEHSSNGITKAGCPFCQSSAKPGKVLARPKLLAKRGGVEVRKLSNYKHHQWASLSLEDLL